MRQVTRLLPSLLALAALCLAAAAPSRGQPKGRTAAAAVPPAAVPIAAGWQMQDVKKVPQTGAQVSSPSYKAAGWYRAVVPGTVLTTLVANRVYPDPLYGENNRPNRIPESLNKTSWWYRTTVPVPASYAGRRVRLNFDGVNYAAAVWVNGHSAGAVRGAFARGTFDVTGMVTPGGTAAVAVLVSPPPNPGIPHEHTISRGMGHNGGVTAIDGPTFLCTIGWDWIPAIRDRDTGIWQKVWLSSTGPVVVKDPLVTTDLPRLPDLGTADVAVRATLQNVSDRPQKGTLTGGFGGIAFSLPVTVEAHATKTVALDPSTVPALRVAKPRLWWPNGYGPQNLYTLRLAFTPDGARTPSDVRETAFGIRKITYAVPDSKNLTLSVNGVRVFSKGGDWGMDEALKRIPRARLDAQIRMHRDAHYTIIRNWVGQSTSEDFYDLCDRYGILVWDEFFQPNPGDGPNPTDLDTYVANVRDKVLRFRNHPSIALWCGRNEGFPPAEIDARLRTLLADLDPARRYQPSSTDGAGVRSHGPYQWRPPRQFYAFGDDEAYKTEIGSVSIPTLDSIHGMLPRKDWETVDDAWAEHDFAAGAQNGLGYRAAIDTRYGPVRNLADFVRKGQMANYEAFRAMYEGRNAKLFAPCTGVITWMSNPAQPSFVWQLYHHDLEPNASLFAVRKACEPVHVQLNEATGHVQVIDCLPVPVTGATVRLAVYNLDGKRVYAHEYPNVTAGAAQATDLGAVAWPDGLSPVHFVKLTLLGADGAPLSDNLYWRALPDHPDDLTALNRLPTAMLRATATRRDVLDRCRLTVTLTNPGPAVALMAHLQLRRGHTGGRVLPVFYSDNYLSLAPGETKTVAIDAAQADLKGENPIVAVDGWNVAVRPFSVRDVRVVFNTEAQPRNWPATGLPVYQAPPKDVYRIDCGGDGVGGFAGDDRFSGGSASAVADVVETAADTRPAPPALYQTERWGEFAYAFPMKPAAGATYTVVLHFADTTFDAPGKRVFSVEIDGKPVLQNFDIVQEAGGKDRALSRVFTGIRPDAKGVVRIAFRRGPADQPEVRGIEVVREK